MRFLRRCSLCILAAALTILIVQWSLLTPANNCPVPLRQSLPACKYNNRSTEELDHLWQSVPGFRSTGCLDRLPSYCAEAITLNVLRQLFEEEHLMVVLRDGSLLEVYRKRPAGDHDVDGVFVLPQGMSTACFHNAFQRVLARLTPSLESAGLMVRYKHWDPIMWIPYDRYYASVLQIRPDPNFYATFIKSQIATDPDYHFPTKWWSANFDIITDDLARDPAYDERMRQQKRGLSPFQLFQPGTLCQCTVTLAVRQKYDVHQTRLCNHPPIDGGPYQNICFDEPVIIDYLKAEYGQMFMVDISTLKELGRWRPEDRGFTQTFDNRRLFFRLPLVTWIFDVLRQRFFL